MKKLLIIALVLLSSCSSLNLQYSSVRTPTQSVIISRPLVYTNAYVWDVNLQYSQFVDCRFHRFYQTNHTCNFAPYNNQYMWNSLPYWNGMGNVYYDHQTYTWNNAYYNLNNTRRTYNIRNRRRLFVPSVSIRSTSGFRNNAIKPVRRNTTRRRSTTRSRNAFRNTNTTRTRRTNSNINTTRSNTPIIKRSNTKRSTGKSSSRRTNN